MDMLDRYLAEVQRYLPRDHATDIIDETGDEIRSQIEDRESSLGRPLTANEEADVLRAYGNPKVVASRYAKQQHLIGPLWLPFYWYALRLVLPVVLGVEVVAGAVVALAIGSSAPFYAALDTAWHSAIYIFGIVTIAFVLLERFGNRDAFEKLDRWDPRKLPNLDSTAPVSRVRSGFEFVVNVLVLLVFADLLRDPHAVSIPPLSLTDAWHPVFIALVVSSGFVVLGALLVYIRPRLGTLQQVARLLGHGAAMAGLAFGLRGGALITAQADSVTADKLLAINMMLTISFVIVLACVAVAAAVTVTKLIRRAYTMSSASA